MKEYDVYKKGQTVGKSFVPPKNFKPTSQSSWCTKNLHGICWSCDHKKFTKLEKIEKSRSHRNGLLRKNLKNVRLCQNFCEQKLLL